jgi:hypothetical protein
MQDRFLPRYLDKFGRIPGWFLPDASLVVAAYDDEAYDYAIQKYKALLDQYPFDPKATDVLRVRIRPFGFRLMKSSRLGIFHGESRPNSRLRGTLAKSSL